MFEFYLHDQVLMVCLSGDLLGYPHESRLQWLGEDYLRIGVSRCVLDLSCTEHINSAGLSILVRMVNGFRHRGGELVLVNPSPQVSRLLAITRLSQVFQVRSNRHEALQYFRQRG